ncbi:C40 family peptidase [Cohnella suwonensis]|uniref:C40 family peptidase n=1 Tax=Cohnella suwonensis TaxID=696072 RepID=A0ABW0M378_9BACL
MTITSTTYTTNARNGKRIATIALGFSILFTGGAALSFAPSAHAATSASVQATGVAVVDKMIKLGKKFKGVRYVYGAKGGQTSSFDCSSLTQYLFKQAGVNLPRSSKQQSKVGTYVAKANLQPGDLVFSDTNRDGVINHVSIYLGNGKLLHTYRVGIGVTFSDFKGSTWDKTYVTARRVLPAVRA